MILFMFLLVSYKACGNEYYHLTLDFCYYHNKNNITTLTPKGEIPNIKPAPSVSL